MEFEIWASDSGNRIFASPDVSEVLAWALDYWLREGDEALAALSVGDEDDRWVVSGSQLRALLHDQMWHATSPWVTSTSVALQSEPALVATH